jgi:hypothetical protein
VAESRDGVDDDREKADRGAERDLGSRAEAEEQYKKRQEQDDGNGIDRGEQRLENLDPIAKAAASSPNVVSRSPMNSPDRRISDRLS